MMKTKILGVLAVGLLAGTMAAHASIVIATDTTTQLTGTWSITSSATAAPVNFLPMLPNSAGGLFGARDFAPDSVAFGTSGFGAPANPFFIGSNAAPIADRSGMFNNNDSRTDVYFLFSNMQDTGGSPGVFSGSFCFSVSRTGCSSGTEVPEPGTLALLGLGLTGLALSRRRKAN